MEAADPADVSNAVEAAVAVANAVDGAAMKAMPASAAATIAVVMAIAMAVFRSMVLFLPKPSIPPAMLIPAAEPKLNAGSRGR